MQKQFSQFGFYKMNHQGFSIIEVMIAITISLILLAGVLQIFLNAKGSHNLEVGFNQLQDNGRFMDEYLMRNVRLAGYRTPPAQTTTFTAINSLFTGGTAYITATNGTGSNGSDTLTVRFQGSGNGTGTPDGTITDCLGSAADSNTMVTNTFSLTNNNELQCNAINANAATANDTQILISGVENFKVLLGEDLDGDNTADRYVPGNYAFLNLNRVVSVRVSILMRSDQPANPFTENSTFYLAGATYTPPADKYIRKEFTYTILLRNLMSNPI
jgi:type IV pilus assembly protein PilW